MNANIEREGEWRDHLAERVAEGEPDDFFDEYDDWGDD